MSNPLLVNCGFVPFGNNLGVSSFLINLCQELGRTVELLFVVPSKKQLKGTQILKTLNDISTGVIDRNEAQNSKRFNSDDVIEVLPHDFERILFGGPTITICHDLHLFDIGWKYDNIDKRRQQYRQNLMNADVVMTHFPRVYYDVERVAEITIPNLFLTESPMLLDTTPINLHGFATSPLVTEEVITLIYPAQLQLHKNHEVLIRALATLGHKADRIKIICPGSEFDSVITDSLRKLTVDFGVSEHVLFPGRLSDQELKQLYWSCNGVIVPSLAEGGAYVALEGIAAEKPVAVNSIPAAVSHLNSINAEVTWFDATDIDDTASTLLDLAHSDPVECLNQNRVARLKIKDMTWENVAKKWIRVIEYLKGEQPRPITQVDYRGSGVELV